WGPKFWVILKDPRTGEVSSACLETGQSSWVPPVGMFLFPPSKEGDWWELNNESSDGIPCYYHPKTRGIVLERPNGLVIPLSLVRAMNSPTIPCTRNAVLGA
ncbi:hypothetical protein M405DRAFT_728111, partial [Rhizopogon salebrosus TDB-379]